MSQHAIGSPLAIAHLADVDRIHPRGRLRVRNLLCTNRRRAGRIRTHDRVEHLAQLVEQRVVEPRADAPSVDELTADHVGELQRAQVTPTALRRREADDDEVARRIGLDLEPLASAPALVRCVRALGDDPLETHGDDLLEKRLADRLDVIEGMQCPEFRKTFHQKRLPSRQRQWTQIEVLAREEVERKKRGG